MTCLYRPFDSRFYSHDQDVVELPRNEVMINMIKSENLGLIINKQVKIDYNLIKI